MDKIFYKYYIADHYCIFERDRGINSLFLDEGLESIYLRVPETRINDMLIEQIISTLEMLEKLNPSKG